MVVLDTSVILKWHFVDEPLADNALALRARHVAACATVVVPSLAFYEFASGLQKRCAPPGACRVALRGLFRLRLVTVPHSQRLLRAAIEAAHAHNLSLYDGVFVALAQMRDLPLVTADRGIVKTKAPRIHHLADIGRSAQFDD